MKALSLWVAVLAVGLFFESSCSPHEHLEMFELGIDMQSSFENDRVRIVIGGHTLLDKQLATNQVLGVCPDGRLSLALPAGDHIVKVTINDGLTTSQLVHLTKDQYVGIMYNRQENETSFIVADSPFLYD